MAFTRKIGASGKFTNQALTLCDNLIFSQEKLVQKAVGWCLKDIKKSEPKKISLYLKKLQTQKAPSIIISYAQKKFKKNIKYILLEDHSAIQTY